jgi:hypothetical protein
MTCSQPTNEPIYNWTPHRIAERVVEFWVMTSTAADQFLSARKSRTSLPYSLIDDWWALLVDHQHQSLLLKGSLGISGVVRGVFCHLNLPKRN